MADELQQGSSRKILTIPNLLSAFRLVLAGVFAAVYLHAKTRQDYHIAVGILVLSGITDCADGKIARHFHMISELGKILDPVADKLTQASVIGCLMVRFPELVVLFVIYVLKEVAMLSGGLIMLKGRKKQVPYARWYGKLSTSEMYTAMALLLIFPSIGKNPVGIWLIIGISLALILFALTMYIVTFLKTPVKEGENE